MSGAEQGITFITTAFGITEMPVHICSLGNERDGPHAPKFVSTRDTSDVLRFVSKWDSAGRGLFFCVGTLRPGTKRLKENVSEIAFLHTDIDFKDIEDTGADVERKLKALRLPPSIIVNSGNGIHAYWLLTEALSNEFDRVEEALRLLADAVGGDLSVCEIARLMRLPGTHNTKNGAMSPVSILTMDGGRRYEFDDIEEWLGEQSPVILRKQRPASEPVDNPFLRAAAALGFKPSIDVEKRLAAMNYMGGGDAAIHATQLAVSASLLNQGVERAEVVSILVDATRAAAGDYGKRWNWRQEEQALERMCATWLKKHPQQPARTLSAAAAKQDDATLASARQREAAVNGAGGAASAAVVNLADARAAKAKPKKKKDGAEAPTVVADGVIEAIRRAGQDILLTEGDVWLYSLGTWHVMTPADQQWIMTLIQEGFEALNEPLKTTNLNAAYKRLCEHPGLYRRDVPWANGDLIVCQNGVLTLGTGKFEQHSPKFYAKRKIGAAYDPAADCPKFASLLKTMFLDRAATDAVAFTRIIQEWAGAALAIGHLNREERKALILVGPSRTGKTELSRVLRLLVGEPVATPSVAEISERFGLSSLYEAAAWIRDDAINEGDDLDPQRFKTIVTGEPIDIERKHRPAVSGVELALPVLLTTNSLPKARDRSDAIFNRSLVLEMTSVVTEEEAHAARAATGAPRGSTIGQYIWGEESAGILNWALDGLATLLQRGSYDVPEVVRNAIQRFKDDNNPVGEWARAAVVKMPHGRVSRHDLMCAYHGWQREQDGDEARAFGARAFFPRLRSVAPWASDHQDHTGKRFINGLHLTDEGLQLWDLHNQGPQLKGGSKGSSLTKLDVNKVNMPASEPGETEVKTDDKTPRF